MSGIQVQTVGRQFRVVYVKCAYSDRIAIMEIVSGLHLRCGHVPGRIGYSPSDFDRFGSY